IFFADVTLGPLQQSGSGLWPRRCDDRIGRQTAEELVGASQFEHRMGLLPLLFRQIVAAAGLAAGNRFQERDRLAYVLQPRSCQHALRVVARHAETVCSRPFGSGGTDRHAGIIAIEQIEVRGGPVYRRRKPRDLVSAADDSVTSLAEPRRLGARILSAGIVVTKRCWSEPRNVVPHGCRRVIGRWANSISHFDLLSPLLLLVVQPFAADARVAINSVRLRVAARATHARISSGPSA